MKTSVAKKDLAELSSDDSRVKYGRAKSLVAIARERPGRLYPHLNLFISLLNGENNILRWTAIDIIGHLSRVDKEKQIDQLLGRFYGFLRGGKLITANHAISALAHVALTKPEYQKRITRELLKTEHNTYETDECRNIVLGKVIQALGLFCNDMSLDGQVVQFIRRQTKNSRSATRKKAGKLLAGVLSRHKRKEHQGPASSTLRVKNVSSHIISEGTT